MQCPNSIIATARRLKLTGRNRQTFLREMSVDTQLIVGKIAVWRQTITMIDELPN